MAFSWPSATCVTRDSPFEGAIASGEGSSDSLRSKASSTSLASLAVRLFLAVSASRAQAAAASTDVIFPEAICERPPDSATMAVLGGLASTGRTGQACHDAAGPVAGKVAAGIIRPTLLQEYTGVLGFTSTR